MVQLILLHIQKINFINNQRHRIDGPAMIFSTGNVYWFYHGKEIKCFSQEEFEKLIKLRLLW